VPFAELCPLKHLRELDLDGNKLTGPLPDWAPHCWPKLRELDLSWWGPLSPPLACTIRCTSQHS
jgi:hypothetical protein